MKNMVKKGFTLVELIVVITIIAILATIAFITLGDYPVDARDSKRKSDISSLTKKISAEIADGKSNYETFMTGAAPITAGLVAPYNGSGVTVKYGTVDVAKLGEDPEAFRDSVNNTNQDYGMIYASGGFGTGRVNCVQLVARGEKTNQLITSGNCKEIVPGVVDGGTGPSAGITDTDWPYSF